MLSKKVLRLIFVLVDGLPSRLFKASRGIRQGDPFPPYLLAMEMEALSAPISKDKERGLISGFKVGNDLEGITHLQFADDTLLFILARWEEMVTLKNGLSVVLSWFWG